MTGFADLLCLCLHLCIVTLMLSVQVDVVVSQHNQTTPPLPDPCNYRTSPPVCERDGDGGRQKEALTEAFASIQKIDLVFVVCATNDCIGTDVAHSRIKLVNQFIIKLINFVATSYGVKIEPKSVQVAVIAYNHSIAWRFFDGIDSGAKIDSCQFKNITSSLETLSFNRPMEQTCKLAEALRLATTLLSQSVRPNTKKVVWAFSDCKICERSNGLTEATEVEKENSQHIQNEADALKKSNDVTIFTVGTSPCPQGFFDTIDKENLLRRVASSNDRHFACIDSWNNFAFFGSSDSKSLS